MVRGFCRDSFRASYNRHAPPTHPVKSAIFDSQIQRSANRPWNSTQIEHGDDDGNHRLNHGVDAKVGSANDGSAKTPLVPWEQFRVPFDPGNGLAELGVKPVRSPELPRFVKGARVPKIMLDELQKLDCVRKHQSQRRGWSARLPSGQIGCCQTGSQEPVQLQRKIRT